MGNLNIDKCFITGLEAHNIDVEHFDYAYSIRIKSKKEQPLLFNKDVHNWINDEYFLTRKHIFAGALINGTLFENPTPAPLVTIELLSNRFSELIYPTTPKEKLDNLFKTLVNMQGQEGQTIDLWVLNANPIFYYGHYFKSKQECNYYFKVLHEKGYIDAVFNNTANDNGLGGAMKATITYEGLNYFIEISEKGQLSNKCFIAMSFDSSTKEIREAIKDAILITGFKPILIDEVHYDSRITINDAIIANLKDCKFCIADFTEHKKGVYFECGFALGQGKPLIYTCMQNDFANSHFDTNHFPHILYNTPEELKLRLIDKINAWVK